MLKNSDLRSGFSFIPEFIKESVDSFFQKGSVFSS
jgi:hypothetical protein